MLQYKTRGGANPQGRPRVYFCSHPLDFTACFPSLSEELLKTQKNCAIWYDDAPETPHDEGSLSDLGQMQLFVIPVTFRLLTAPSRAMDVELPFALEHHIPVLPIMQARGLEALFAEKFGDLQFLDPFNTDPTAIPYEERLQRYLSSILIGDELAKKIRAAFDAYVFLSYRKKDRKYAQELMRLIHKNDRCRDLAIWYDEFLTPGEDFNDAIREALEKSKLFLLAVTPNLVNEPNYIMTTEYPLAKGAGKPILPAELVSTDKALLAEKYDGIPPCVNPYGESGPSDALLSFLKRLSLQRNGNSPEHQFLMGLAYLGGLDVEVDHEKAVSLITSAAEADFPEAVDLLVDMYRSGHGVERSYETAIFWLEKKIRHQKDRYNTSPTETHLHELFSAYHNCGEFCEDLGKLSQAKQQYTKALSCLTNFPGRTSEKIRYHTVCALILIGDIDCMEGRPQDAAGFFRRALEETRALLKESETAQLRRTLAICYSKLGHAAMEQGELSHAKNCFESEFQILSPLADTVPSVKRDLAVACNHLGSVCQMEGDWEGAKDFFEEGLMITEALAHEQETVDSARDLSVSYNRLGTIWMMLGDPEKACFCLMQDLAITEYLAKEVGAPAFRRSLSISYNRLGDFFREQEDYASAADYYEKALDIAQLLHSENNTAESARDLAVTFNNLGCNARAVGELSQAENFFRDACEIFEALAKETDTLDSLSDLSGIYDNLGSLQQTLEDFASAKIFFEKALTVSKALAEKSGTPAFMRDLSGSWDRLANLALFEDDLPAAKSYFEKSFAILESLAAKHDMFRQNLLLCCGTLGGICNVLGEREDSRKYFLQAVSIAETVDREGSTVDTLDDLAASYANLAPLMEDEFSKKMYFQRAYDIYTQLRKEDPHNPRYQETLAAIRQYLKPSPRSHFRNFFSR